MSRLNFVLNGKTLEEIKKEEEIAYIEEQKKQAKEIKKEGISEHNIQKVVDARINVNIRITLTDMMRNRIIVIDRVRSFNVTREAPQRLYELGSNNLIGMANGMMSGQIEIECALDSEHFEYLNPGEVYDLQIVNNNGNSSRYLQCVLLGYRNHVHMGDAIMSTMTFNYGR